MRLLALYWPIIVLLAVVALRVLQIWARNRKADSDEATPLEQITAINPMMLLLSGVSLAAGIGVFYFFVLSSLVGYLASRSWVATPCTILASAVEYGKDSEGEEVSRLVIRYSYEVAGRRLEGERYEFGFDGFSGGREPKQRLADAFPAGAHTTCWVDPEEPKQSVVSRDFSRSLHPLLAFCLIFTAAGATLLLVGTADARSKLRTGVTLRTSISRRAPPTNRECSRGMMACASGCGSRAAA